MNEENDLVFFEELQKNKRKEKCKKKEVEEKFKQTLDLKNLRELIDRGLYEPNLDKVAEAFIEEELNKDHGKGSKSPND